MVLKDLVLVMVGAFCHKARPWGCCLPVGLCGRGKPGVQRGLQCLCPLQMLLINLLMNEKVGGKMGIFHVFLLLQSTLPVRKSLSWQLVEVHKK